MSVREATRSVPINISGKSPSSFDRESRSVSVIATTEDPAPTWDYDLGGQVGEVLLMSGVKLPKGRQMPLLDTHSRYGVSDILGSARDLKTEDDMLTARAVFSSVPAAEEAMTKIEEGHLTDFSIGYRVLKEMRIKKDESAVLGGKTFTGPLIVVTSWQVKELSVCPIGADPRAKARAVHSDLIDNPDLDEPGLGTNPGGDIMTEATRSTLEKLGLRNDASEQEAQTFLDEFLTRAATPPVTPDPAPAAEDVDGQVRQALADERTRMAEITRMCRDIGLDDLAEGLITDGLSIDQARAVVFEKAKLKLRALGGPGVPGGSAAPAVPDPQAPVEERAKAAWDADANLRAEFQQSFDSYLAYTRAAEQGQARIFMGARKEA